MSSPSSAQWLSLVGAIWLQTINGPNSDFPVYSSQLKDLKSLSQVQLNFLAFASDAGKLFGWFSGVAAIFLPLWLVSVIGATFGLIGYGIQFFFLRNTHLSFWHLFMLTSLAGNGICWINTVCYLICIQNFPSDRHVAVGLSTSYVGLSAKVYTVVVDAIFHPQRGDSAKAYLLLNAIVPMLVSLLVSPFLRKTETKNKARSSCGFLMMFAITLATGICAVFGSIRSVSRKHMISLGLLLTAPLLIPLAMQCREGIEGIWWNKREMRVHDITVHEVETGERVIDLELEERAVDEKVEESVEVGGLQLLRKVDFWLYFFSYMFSATLGLVFLNNLGQIAESRGFSKTSTLVSLSSSFGFFGRLMPSLLDYCSTTRGYMVPRPAFMATLMVPVAGAFFLLLNPSRLFLYLSTAIIGACTGAITSIAVSATPELFGTKHFGVNHNIVVTNIPIGSFVFGYLAALLYQKGDDKESYSCTGTGCYDKTFIIWGSTCSLATLLCTVLHFRTRKFC